VAVVGDYLYVVFQRTWPSAGDPGDRARLGRYDRTSGEWTFAYYPLDPPSSPNGGWVMLSELAHLGDGRFAVIERDNQAGPDARIKRVYTFSVAGVAFRENADTPSFEVVDKVLTSDLIADGVFDRTGGLVPEKPEGLTVLADGTALIVNDNNGVDGTSGETQLIGLGELFAFDGKGHAYSTRSRYPSGVPVLAADR
jgi:hypothetical protein